MPQGPTINYQGRQPMARNNPAGETWGAFLRTRLAARNNMNQADFRRAMEAEGFPISKQTVSQWFNGENAADPNMATVVATILGADPAEAMRAAGYAIAVERIRPGADAGNFAHAAVVGEPADPAVEETVKEIMGMTFLGLKVRRALVDQYLADEAQARADAQAAKEEARQRARSLAKAWSPNGDESDGSAA